ncbi:hypothetical protein O7626_24980 [Micromonospora sp. WMMD1102]|uniref:hypothetical protein n=1 Tax=Micromonospora sp. WMMD1102 TaxID=3016105 RepID=UPI00241589BD|nr:hypothetical protein [Micromonospora sp. WMMD1102]MDG4789146.1 hypothetical protein [Micromonospora sp. WMMD1102]
MRGKLWFVGGLAVGFVLGARAGRERYEELVLKGRQVLDHPTVQEAAGVAQAQASRLYSEGKDRLSHSRLGEKFALGDGSESGSGTGSGGHPETTVGSGTSGSGTTSGTSAKAGSGTGTKSSTTAPTSRAASGANGTSF